MKSTHHLTENQLDRLTDKLAAERDDLHEHDRKFAGLDRAIELIQQAQTEAATARLNRLAKKAHC